MKYLLIILFICSTLYAQDKEEDRLHYYKNELVVLHQDSILTIHQSNPPLYYDLCIYEKTRLISRRHLYRKYENGCRITTWELNISNMPRGNYIILLEWRPGTFGKKRYLYKTLTLK